MTCSTPGCYAKTFRRNLCRNHFYAWDQQLPAPAKTTAPRKRKEALRATPVPPSGVCVCSDPIIMPVWPFPGAQMCQRCGRPPIESLTPRKESA